MHGLELVPNVTTLLFQLGIFIAVFFVLKFLVFGPYIKLVQMRHSKTDGLKEQAAEAAEKAEKFRNEYEAFMLDEKRKVAKTLEDGRKRVAEEESKILSAARQKVAGQMEEVRAGIERDITEAHTALSPLVPEFASAMSSKLLGKEVKLKSNNSRPPSGEQPAAPG